MKRFVRSFADVLQRCHFHSGGGGIYLFNLFKTRSGGGAISGRAERNVEPIDHRIDHRRFHNFATSGVLFSYLSICASVSNQWLQVNTGSAGPLRVLRIVISTGPCFGPCCPSDDSYTLMTSG